MERGAAGKVATKIPGMSAACGKTPKSASRPAAPPACSFPDHPPCRQGRSRRSTRGGRLRDQRCRL